MLRKFFVDRHGRITIVQSPNPALAAWAGTAIAAHLLSPGNAADGLRVASRTALIVWAVMEIGWGASYFRRVLGLIVLAWSVYTIFW